MYQGASLVLTLCRVMVVGLSGIVERLSNCLYVRTNPLSWCIDRLSWYIQCNILI